MIVHGRSGSGLIAAAVSASVGESSLPTAELPSLLRAQVGRLSTASGCTVAPMRDRPHLFQIDGPREVPS